MNANLPNTVRLCDTAEMSRRQWLEMRKHGPLGDIPVTVGGSDVATVLNISPWKTKLELWWEKTGRKKSITYEQNEGQKEMGNLLEPIVAHLFYRKTGFEVIEETGLFAHPYYEWALANIDYLFIDNHGEIGILECKTTTYHMADKWKSKVVPDYYEWQVRFYMAVLGLQQGYVACLWGTNPNTDFVVCNKIERDLALEKLMFKELNAFINEVKTDTMPAIEHKDPDVAIESLKRIYGLGEVEKNPIRLDITYRKNVENILELLKQKKQLNEDIKVIENEIQRNFVPIAAELKDNTSALCRTSDGKVFNIIYKPSTRVGVDKEKLETFYPKIFKDTQKTTVSKSPKFKELKVLSEVIAPIIHKK